MITSIRSSVRSAEPTASSRRGANARKRDESDSMRRAEVRREAASHAAGIVRRVLAVVAVCGSLVGGGFALRELALTRGWIALEAIEVTSFHQTSVQEILDLSALKRGTPLNTIDLAVVRARLVGHPWIADAKVTRAFPHRLRIVLVERHPVAALSDGRWVGEDGRIMDPRGSWMLPVVAGFSDNGRRIAPSGVPVLEALAGVSRRSPQLLARLRDTRMEKDGSLSLRLAGFPPLVRIRPEDWKLGLARAGVLERELMTESEQIAEIDLRQGSCAALRRREGGA